MKLFTNRLNHHEQAIEVQEKRFGYFPTVFRWQGHRYNVLAVEHCWSTRRPRRLNFRVRCHEGVFDLSQNLHANVWHLNMTSVKPAAAMNPVRRNLIQRLVPYVQNKFAAVSRIQSRSQYP